MLLSPRIYTWAHAIDNLSSTFSDAFSNYNTGLLDPFNPRGTLDKHDIQLALKLIF